MFYRPCLVPLGLCYRVDGPTDRPTACRYAGLSVEGTLYNPNHFAATLPDDAPIVFYIGAMASGHLTKDENPEVCVCV